MDIVEKVAEAIDQNPQISSSYQLARVAIEEYQKALWTPYFDLDHRGLALPERRRHWTNSLVSHIMHAIGKYICDHGDARGSREASRALFDMIYDSGAYIVTDADRSAAGLPARGAYGLTLDEMAIMEAKHTQAMLAPLPPMILPAPRSP